jgi:hypothetical protein
MTWTSSLAAVQEAEEADVVATVWAAEEVSAEMAVTVIQMGHHLPGR